MASGNHLPLSHPNKDGRATDNCFSLFGAYQCGVLVEGQDGCISASISATSETLVVSMYTNILGDATVKLSAGFRMLKGL